MRAVVVEPVRIDLRKRGREARLGHVMIDDDDVEPGFGRGGKRLMRGRAAIDRDHDRCPVGFEAQESRRVWAIAFAHAVGDIERGACADRGEEP